MWTAEALRSVACERAGQLHGPYANRPGPVIIRPGPVRCFFEIIEPGPNGLAVQVSIADQENVAMIIRYYSGIVCYVLGFITFEFFP